MGEDLKSYADDEMQTWRIELFYDEDFGEPVVADTGHRLDKKDAIERVASVEVEMEVTPVEEKVCRFEQTVVVEQAFVAVELAKTQLVAAMLIVQLDNH